MLTKEQKRLLENHIYGLLQESIFENGFYEEDHKESPEHHSAEMKDKEDAVLGWLDDHKEKKSVLAYELWPGKDKDSARSQFSKKAEGEDADGKAYHFDDDEINDLYNMIGSKIKHSDF